MRKSVACSVPYGSGGLGLHFTQIVETIRFEGKLGRYYTPQPQEGDASGKKVVNQLSQDLNYPPVRQSSGWRNYLDGELFDRSVASQMTHADSFQGFGGQSLHSFNRARQLGCEQLILMAANSHVDHVSRQHRQATATFNLERSWLNDVQRRKTILEYQAADFIEVASEYTRKSFLDAGFSPEKLVRTILNVHPRFVPQCREPDGVFRIVYTGSLTVMKGIPILLEAFSRFPERNSQLILVGGWATGGMRRYIEFWLAKDTRIRLSPGDPLPHLKQADVYVHPTYEDGFAYAPMEALACGVPVIVTEDTGMKEYVKEGVNGHIVPTGNWEEILERLIACHQHNLRGELV